MSHPALEEAWRKYRGWAARARTIRARLDRSRRNVLLLTVGGAVLATLAGRMSAWFGDDGGLSIPLLNRLDASVVGQGLSGLSAAAMALAAYLSRSVLDPSTERQWLRARALAESCKSECFRFATQVPPYEDAEAGRRLLEKLQQLLASGAEIPAMEVSDEDAARGLPAYPLTVEAYQEQRLLEQVQTYYRPKAEENERKANLFGQWVQGLSAAAAVLAALGAVYGAGVFEVWVATLGAIAAAVGSYALSQRFQRLAATYSVTADRLALRRALWLTTRIGQTDAAADQALVIDAEAVMSAENEAWLAEFLKDPTAPAQAGAPVQPNAGGAPPGTIPIRGGQ